MPRTKTTSHSPVPIPKLIENRPCLIFEDAISKVKGGAKITKLEWNNPEYYGVFANGFLMLHKPDGKLYQWIISEGDLLGEDWIVM